MYSLDTNIVLRYLLDDVSEQTVKARGLIVDLACYITDVVATEVVFVLERVIGMERSDITKLVLAFLSLPNIVYADYLLDETFDLYIKQPQLSFVDCYAAIEARVYKNTLYTFDKELANRGGNHVHEL